MSDSARSSAGRSRYPRRHSARAPARLRSGSSGTRGCARHEQARVGDAQDGVDGVGQPLVVADHAECEDGPAVVGTWRIAAEHGVGNHAELCLGHAERGQRLAAPHGVDDHTVEAREERAPETGAAGRASRQEIVRGEHEGSVGTEQEPVDLRNGKPLKMDDVRGTGEHAAGRERVLQRLERQPYRIAAGPGRPWVETLHEAIAVGSGSLAEAELRRDELYIRTRARQR